MKRYVVGRKCDAIEWVFVSAENETKARYEARDGDSEMATLNLEFNGYQSAGGWIVKELTTKDRRDSEEQENPYAFQEEEE